MSKYNLVSLFTGAGGLDLGLEMAGFSTFFANEIEPHACETLRKNKLLCNASKKEIERFVFEISNQRCYQGLSTDELETLTKRLYKRSGNHFLENAEIIEGDIRNVSESQILQQASARGIKDVFCVAGGPPCQPFSRAGKRQAVDDIRNGDLFYEFVRIVDKVKPLWFVFENVKGLVLTKTEVFSYKCMDCDNSELIPFEARMKLSREEEVSIECSKCNSKNISIQKKNKSGGSLDIILNEFRKIGYYCNYSILNAADFGAPQIRERLFIVGNRENIPFKWPISTHSETKDIVSQKSLFETVEKKQWVSMFDALWKDGHSKYGKLNTQQAVLWVKNVVRPHDEAVTWNLHRPSPTIGAHQGAKLAIAPTGVPEAQLLRQQWHVLGKRQGDTKPVFVEHEYLSDEELLCLQTFPSWWYLHGTRMQRAFQIGNAVPPILAKVIGLALIESNSIWEKNK